MLIRLSVARFTPTFFSHRTIQVDMPNPIAPSLFAAPRAPQPKQLLRAALADHKKHLTGTRPPNPDRKLAYDDMLQHFARSRGGPLFFPYLGSGIGNGALVEL